MTLLFLNDVANGAESTQNKKHVIIASLKSESVGKLINRIPALRTHVESLGKPCDVNKRSQNLAW